MNKLLLLTSIILLIATQTKAQTSVYHPLPDSNAYWNQSFGYTPDGSTCIETDYSIYINGDSIVGGNTYKKFYANSYTCYCSQNCGSSVYHPTGLYALIRQDSANKKVYQYDGTADVLIYDFNLTVGDSMYNSGAYYPIISVDSILVGSDYRKRLNLESCVSIIEGIGSTYGLGLFPQYECPFEHWYTLYCINVNGQTLWGIPDNCNFITSTKEQSESIFSFYPNPATNQLCIHISSLNKEEHLTVCIMNVLGQASPPASRNSAGLSSGEPLQRRGEDATIDISKLPAGIYFLQVRTEKGSVTKKFVKQ